MTHGLKNKQFSVVLNRILITSCVHIRNVDKDWTIQSASYQVNVRSSVEKLDIFEANNPYEK